MSKGKITVNIPKGRKMEAILALSQAVSLNANAVTANARAIEILTKTVNEVPHLSNISISNCNLHTNDTGIIIGQYLDDEKLEDVSQIFEQEVDDIDEQETEVNNAKIDEQEIDRNEIKKTLTIKEED